MNSNDAGAPQTKRIAMSGVQAALIWAAVVSAIAIPVGVAAASPLLAWREPIYIAASFAGVVGLSLMLIQPLLVGGYLPGLAGYIGRRVHLWVGAALVVAVVIHVGGLWLTSPPDVIDALVFASPTPFSVWGVIAMWAIFASALWAAVRHPLRIRPRLWRMTHTALAVVIVVGTVVHGLLIEGTMGTVSKVALSALVVAATVKVVADLRIWAKRPRAAVQPEIGQ